MKDEKVEPQDDALTAEGKADVIPFEDIRKRLARGGNFSGGNGGGNGTGTHTNYLQYIPKGAMFLARSRKVPNSFVLDQFLIYAQLPEGVTAIEPIIPGVGETSIWWVDQQIFCNNYQHYVTIETPENDQRNRTD